MIAVKCLEHFRKVVCKYQVPFAVHLGSNGFLWGHVTKVNVWTAWIKCHDVPLFLLENSFLFAAVISGFPAPEAVQRVEGATRYKTAPLGIFPTGTPSPACHRRQISGYAVHIMCIPLGKFFHFKMLPVRLSVVDMSSGISKVM